MSKIVVDELPVSCSYCPCLKYAQESCPFNDSCGNCYERFVELKNFFVDFCHEVDIKDKS